MPNNIQIELVEGCDRMCRFCGIWGIWRDKKYRKKNFMDFNLATQLAESLYDWDFNKKRIEFAMHGEPTLHPDLIKIIAYFRERLPLSQLQITTNGMVLPKRGAKYIDKLFAAGLNIMLVDTYDGMEPFLKLVPQIKEEVTVLKYHDLGDFNPYYYKGPKGKTICLFGDLGENTGQKRQRTIINHAGNSDKKVMREEFGIPPVLAPLSKNCSKPFREMIIHWDGTVPICCLDWKHEHIIHRFPGKSMQDIWESTRFNLARQAFKRKIRAFRPCYNCNHKGGFRLGLLPKLTEFNDEPDVSLLKKIKSYLAKNKKYNHPTTTNDIMFQPKQKGIQKFI